MQPLADAFLGASNENVLAFALLAARALGLVFAAPGWNTPWLDFRARPLIALALAWAASPAIIQDIHLPRTPADFVVAAAIEAAIGAAIGFAAALVVQAARAAGDLIAIQAGLSHAGLLQPETDAGASPLGQLFGSLALCAFLTLDGPLQLVRSFVQSYHVIETRSLENLLGVHSLPAVCERLAASTALAAQFAAPIALALVITSIALALVARIAPSAQSLASSHLVRIAVGIILVALGVAGITATFESAWNINLQI
jgi:flagellar biosynthetic protein FliR